jgi:hypothetical protein
MSEQLIFSLKHFYPDDPDGITLEVILRHGDEVVRVPASVDCGAAFCVFSREIGVLLGLDIESGLPKRFGSLAGKIDAFGHDVTIQFAEIVIPATVYFAKYPGISRNLLGRNGWIRQLRVGLVDYENTIYLAQYDG